MDLKTASLQARLTQQQVAQAVMVSTATISNLERGVYRPHPETARKLERLFGQVLTLYPEDIRGSNER